MFCLWGRALFHKWNVMWTYTTRYILHCFIFLQHTRDVLFFCLVYLQVWLVFSIIRVLKFRKINGCTFTWLFRACSITSCFLFYRWKFSYISNIVNILVLNSLSYRSIVASSSCPVNCFLYCVSYFVLVCVVSSGGMISCGDPDDYPGAISTAACISTFNTHDSEFFVLVFQPGNLRVHWWWEFSAHSHVQLSPRVLISLEDFLFTCRVGLLAYLQQIPQICRCSASSMVRAVLSGTPLILHRESSSDSCCAHFSWARFCTWMAMTTFDSMRPVHSPVPDVCYVPSMQIFPFLLLSSAVYLISDDTSWPISMCLEMLHLIDLAWKTAYCSLTKCVVLSFCCSLHFE